MIGVAKANSMVDIGKLEYCVRDDLNQTAPRVLGVLRPIEVELAGGRCATVDAPYFPPDVGKPGSRALPISDRIFIDRDDWRDEPPAGYQRLAPGRTVRLRHGHCITADEVVARDGDGRVTKLRATRRAEIGGKNGPSRGHRRDPLGRRRDERARRGAALRSAVQRRRSPKKAAATSSSTSTRLARGRARRARSRRRSRARRSARAGSSSASATSASTRTRGRARWCSTASSTLRDDGAWPRTPPRRRCSRRPRQKNAKAQTRPKSKSPREYRAEARERDPALAAFYAQLQAALPADQADLLSGDADRKAVLASRGRRGAARRVDHQRAAARARRRGAGGSSAARLAEHRATAGGARARGAGQDSAREMIATASASGSMTIEAAPAHDSARASTR